jgi:HD-GYP domain-containing protein (c-di-GMP phosphodiesterase class II)
MAGEEIPLPSRIIFAADAFDAMTSERPYRDPLTVEQAIAELRQCAGSQFDPMVVEMLLREIDAAPVPEVLAAA